MSYWSITTTVLAIISLVTLLGVQYMPSNRTGLNHPLALRSSTDRADPQADHLVLAVEWPGTVCGQRSCSAEYDPNMGTNKWNFHGLWPNGATSLDVEGCSTENYDESVASQDPLKSHLDEFWGGLYNSASVFHRHEFEKHGRCWSPNIGTPDNMHPEIKDHIVNTARPAFENGDPLMTSFFDTVYNIHKRWDFHQILADAKLTPGNSYTLEQFEDALAQHTDDQATGGIHCVQLICYSHSIQEIRIQLDTSYNPYSDSNRYSDDAICPTMKGNGCPDDITYPAHE